jgi:hypothetical protein
MSRSIRGLIMKRCVLTYLLVKVVVSIQLLSRWIRGWDVSEGSRMISDRLMGAIGKGQ